MATSHSQQVIEIEAESLEEARMQVKSQIPLGLSILSEKIISDGKPKTVKGIAETMEEAYAQARSKIPNGADIVGEKEITKPERNVVTVEAFDEQSARTQAGNQSGSTAIVKGIKLVSSGSKGFLGIGKKPNQYEVEILLHQAVVEISYKVKAKIVAEIGKAPPPKFITKRQTPSGTYEVYQGDDAESARNFLASKKVTQMKYYIKVETPEGNWGVDIDGLYLEQIVSFQLNINSAQCEGTIIGTPTPSSLQYAFNKIADNFVVMVRCGKCNHEWHDGVRYKNVTVVRCPNCSSLNKVDSSPHIEQVAGTLVWHLPIS